jgi:hypothetical protein
MMRVNVGSSYNRSSISDNRAESWVCALADEQPFPGPSSASSAISQDAARNSVMRLNLPRKGRRS